ncbi:RNA binding protein, putative, partial [Ricinus communis]
GVLEPRRVAGRARRDRGRPGAVLGAGMDRRRGGHGRVVRVASPERRDVRGVPRSRRIDRDGPSGRDVLCPGSVDRLPHAPERRQALRIRIQRVFGRVQRQPHHRGEAGGRHLPRRHQLVHQRQQRVAMRLEQGRRSGVLALQQRLDRGVAGLDVGADVAVALGANVAAADARAMAEEAQHPRRRLGGLAQVALGAAGAQRRAEDQQFRRAPGQAGADRVEQVPP